MGSDCAGAGGLIAQQPGCLQVRLLGQSLSGSGTHKLATLWVTGPVSYASRRRSCRVKKGQKVLRLALRSAMHALAIVAASCVSAWVAGRVVPHLSGVDGIFWRVETEAAFHWGCNVRAWCKRERQGRPGELRRGYKNAFAWNIICLVYNRWYAHRTWHADGPEHFLWNTTLHAPLG